MVALCFANGLQGGGAQTFAQAIDSIKHAFHVNDFAIGVIPACVGIAGNVGAVPVAHFCARHKRITVLAFMFFFWGVLITLAGVVPDFRLAGFAAAGFVLFAVLRVASSFLEATDPAALPLIADWWPVSVRARQVSIFNTVAGLGAFGGLIGSGIVIDDFGWRWAFAMWLPPALLGAFLIRRQREPVRGGQDAVYAAELEASTAGEEHDRVVELVEEAEVGIPVITGGPPTSRRERWEVVRSVFSLRSWRLVAIGLAVTGVMGDGLGAWGLTYFKRTFHLSSAKVGALTPLLGAGAFLGVLGGGFLSDWMVKRGILRARLILTAGGFAGAGVLYVVAFSGTRLAVSAPLIALAAALSSLPTGPQYAAMMDVTPASLRSQASAATNVLQACGSVGALVVGGLSTALGNLRLALLCVSPFYVLGAALIAAAARTYVQDVAVVVGAARSGQAGGEPPAPAPA